MQAVPLAQLRELMPSDSKAAGSMQDGALIRQMAAVHESRLFCNAAPRQYVAFVAMFRKVFAQKQEQLLEQQSFLKVLPATYKATSIKRCPLASDLHLKDTFGCCCLGSPVHGRLPCIPSVLARRNNRLPWQLVPQLAVVAVRS